MLFEPLNTSLLVLLCLFLKSKVVNHYMAQDCCLFTYLFCIKFS